MSKQHETFALHLECAVSLDEHCDDVQAIRAMSSQQSQCTSPRPPDNFAEATEDHRLKRQRTAFEPGIMAHIQVL